MSAIRSIHFAARSEFDLREPFLEASWLARSLQIPLTVFLHRGLAHAKDSIQSQLRQSSTPTLELPICFFENDLLSLMNELSLNTSEHLWILSSQNCDIRSDVSLDDFCKSLIEEIPSPILLFPCHYESRLPWSTILVPMSGEFRGNRALQQSIGFANQLKIAVNIIHISDPDRVCSEKRGVVSQFSDNAHHELSPMIDQFISQACPFSSSKDKRVIRNFQVLRGDAKTSILKEVREGLTGLIAIEWKGKFAGDRAQILKALLAEVKSPLLLVKPLPQVQFRLKAGHQLQVA